MPVKRFRKIDGTLQRVGRGHQAVPDRSVGDRLRSKVNWQKLRSMKLALDPLCEMCSEDSQPVAAAEVHHIQPIEDKPERAYDMDNLQSLCCECHRHHHRPEAIQP